MMFPSGRTPPESLLTGGRVVPPDPRRASSVYEKHGLNHRVRPGVNQAHWRPHHRALRSDPGRIRNGASTYNERAAREVRDLFPPTGPRYGHAASHAMAPRGGCPSPPAGDQKDGMTLVKHLKIRTVEEGTGIHARLFPHSRKRGSAPEMMEAALKMSGWETEPEQ